MQARILSALQLIALLSCSVTSAVGQTSCFPIDPNSNQVVLKGKIITEDFTKDEVFSQIVAWGVTKASGEREVLKDRESGVFKFHNQVNYRYKDGIRGMYYSISIKVNEGSFDYTVNGFTMNNKPMEEYLIGKTSDAVYTQVFEEICLKVTECLNEMKRIGK
jgi:hypothetical protein